MPTFRFTTKRLGPAPLATVAAAMETYLEALTTTATLQSITFVETHRDNQVMCMITHDTVLQPLTISIGYSVPTTTAVYTPP